MIDPSLFAQVAADAQAMTAALPDDDKVRNIATLAAKQLRLERRVARTQQVLALRETQLARVSEVELPEALLDAGLSEVKLPDGSKITVGNDIFTNIPSADADKSDLIERRVKAFRWLRDNGHEDLIKQEIKVACGRGEAEQAKARRVIAGLDKVGIPYTNTEAIHHSTLKAFVKEQVEKENTLSTEGTAVNPLPRDVFGVHIKRVAKIRPVSQRKGK